jgi:hypothetical protein
MLSSNSLLDLGSSSIKLGILYQIVPITQNTINYPTHRQTVRPEELLLLETVMDDCICLIEILLLANSIKMFCINVRFQ